MMQWLSENERSRPSRIDRAFACPLHPPLANLRVNQVPNPYQPWREINTATPDLVAKP